MTSFAFILGVVPLVRATGAGAEMRYTLGVAVFTGMLPLRRQRFLRHTIKVRRTQHFFMERTGLS
jgi:hypothetical protein